jgi:hypothetical protein
MNRGVTVKAKFGIYEIEHSKNPDGYVIERKGVYLLSDCGRKKVGFVRRHADRNLISIPAPLRNYSSIDVLYIRDSIFPDRELSRTPTGHRDWIDSLDEGVDFIIDSAEKDLEAYWEWLFHL